MNIRSYTRLYNLSHRRIYPEPLPESTPSQPLSARAGAMENHSGRVEAVQRFMQYYATIAPHARSGSLRLPPSEWRAMSVGEYDGMEWLFIASRGNGTNSVLPVGMLMDGMLGVILDFNHTMDCGEVFLGPMFALWSNQLWLGAEVGYNDPQGYLGIRPSGSLTLSAQDALEVGASLDSGPYGNVSCFEAARIRSRVLPVDKGDAFRAEVKKSRQHGWATVLGLNIFAWMRLLTRVDYTSSTDISYQTWVDAVSAKFLSMDGVNVFIQWLRNTWRACWNIEALHVPDLKQPECLMPGDVLTKTLGQQQGRLFAAGLKMLYRGRHHAVSDRVTVKLECLVSKATTNAYAADVDNKMELPKTRDWEKPTDLNELALTLSCEHLSSKRDFISIPGGAGYDWGQHRPKETSWRLKLPMNAKNMDAYRRFIQSLEQRKSNAEIAELVEQLSAETQITFEQEESLGCSYSYELGVRVAIFPMNLWNMWMPDGFCWGLGNHGSKTEFTQREVDSDRRLKRSRTFHIHEKQKLRGPDGERRQSAMTVVDRSIQADGRSISHLWLGSRIYGSRVDASEVTRLIIDPLNQAYGTHFAPLRGAGWRVSQDVSFEQKLTATQIRNLLPLVDASADRLATIADGHAQALKHCLESICVQLDKIEHGAQEHGQADDEVLLHIAAQAFDAYFEKSGVFGVGSIYRALQQVYNRYGDAIDRELMVYSTSNAYQRPQAIFDAIALRYQDVQRSQIEKRNREIDSGLEEISLIFQRIQRDPFLDNAQKFEYGNQIASVRLKLQNLREVAASEHQLVPEEQQLMLDVQSFLREHSPTHVCNVEQLKQRRTALGKLASRIERIRMRVQQNLDPARFHLERIEILAGQIERWQQDCIAAG